jgi:Skp family chaperone for outer membrane proteins
MHRQCFFVLGSVVALSLPIASGCGTSLWPSSETGGRAASTAGRLSGVAIVDLDEVAKQLGVDVWLVKDIRNGQDSLNQQLRTYQSTLQEKYRQKAHELEAQPVAGGSNPEARKQQLTDLQRQFNLQLNEAQRSAQNELSVYRQKLIQRFREEVVPVAQEVAGQRGLGVVLTKNDTVLLAFDDAHDITSAVVARLRTRRTVATEAAATSSPSSPTTQRR